MIPNARRFAAALLALPLLAAGTHAQTTLDCQPPEIIGLLDGIIEPTAITIEDNYAYIIEDREYFSIVDLADPSAPTLLARVGLIGDDPSVITIIGDAAYLHSEYEISIYNIEDKTDPWFRRFYSGLQSDLYLNARTQSHIYLERDFALNIDRPLAPGIDRYQPIEEPFDGNPVIIHNGQLITEKLSRYDLTDPLNPALISDVPFGNLTPESRYDEPYLIYSDAASVEITTLHDHTPIVLKRSITTMGQDDATVRGDLIFTASGTIDVYAPATYPLLVASFMLDPDFYAMHIRRLGDNFVVLSANQLAIVSIPTNPLGALWPHNTGEYLTKQGDTLVAIGTNLTTGPNAGAIIDTSDPSRPEWIAELPFNVDNPNPRAAVFAGSILYAPDLNSGLHVFDVSNPHSPVNMGLYQTNPKGSSRILDVEVQGNILLAIDQNRGIFTFEIQPDASLVPLGSLDFFETVYRVEPLGDIAFVASQSEAYLVDITNPSAPALLSTLAPGPALPPSIPSAHRDGNLLYTAESDYGYRIYDISDPADPIELAHFDADVSTPQGDFQAFVYDILVEDNTLYVAMSSGGFAIYDNTNIFAPVLLAHAPATTPPDISETRYREFIKEGNNVYIAAGEAGVHVLSLDGCSIPCVIDYNNDGALDFFDVTAFIVAFNNTDPAADLNDDGELNFFDITAFITAFQSGCP
ncbi:MAG: GC-type dockerin domain-anchored protein [Phycisphaerales bacterium]